MFSFLLVLLQVSPDTLSQAYADRWDGPPADESWFSSFMTSNDMIFVVLGVSLLIWATLLFYLFATDAKLSRIEKELNNIK